MDPDQTAPKGAVWSGFIVFASMVKSSVKYTWIYALDIKSRQHFKTKSIGGLRVKIPFCHVKLFFFCIKRVSLHKITFESNSEKNRAILGKYIQNLQAHTFKKKSTVNKKACKITQHAKSLLNIDIWKRVLLLYSHRCIVSYEHVHTEIIIELVYDRINTCVSANKTSCASR